MSVWLRLLGCLAGLMGAGGVALAAAGAHRSGAPTVTTAAYFLLFHAAALIGLCAVLAVIPSRLVAAAAGLLAAGAIIFAGDLALRGLADLTLVHMAAPTGGILMILGWLGVSVALPIMRQPAPGHVN